MADPISSKQKEELRQISSSYDRKKRQAVEEGEIELSKVRTEFRDK